jgi:hypothetical protein
VAINACAKKRRVAISVLIAARPEIIDNVVLGFAVCDCEVAFKTNGGGQMCIQIFEISHTDGVEHLAAFNIRFR